MEKLKWFLYFTALMIICVPTAIVVLTDDVTFSSTFSQTLISTAIILVILGKGITVFKKRNENKNFPADIGAIIGLSIVLLARLF